MLDGPSKTPRGTNRHYAELQCGIWTLSRRRCLPSPMEPHNETRARSLMGHGA